MLLPNEGNDKKGEKPSKWEKTIANNTTENNQSLKYTRSSWSSIPDKWTTQSKSGPKN